jgi:MoaA/NifB/PqqE/SkfB family radical SAM enzyme
MYRLLKKRAFATRRHINKRLTPLLSDVRYDLLYRYRKPDIYRRLVGAKNRLSGTLIRIEASSVCQLKCRACSMARTRGKETAVGWGILPFAEFKRLLDENPHIKAVELSNWGEIFLNPELKDIMRYAHQKGVRLRAVNGVNLNRVDEETLEALVKYRFGQLTVSIDGASHETYKQYRRRGSFNAVIENIKRINALKAQYDATKPRLIWQFIVFGHNEHEIEKAQKMAEELEMELRFKLNHTPKYSPIRDKERVVRLTGIGAASRDDYVRRSKRFYSRPCMQLWDSPQINWDGKLLGCCANKFGDFGNVFELGLEPALAAEPYRYAQRMVLGLEPPREDLPCYRCKVYWKALEQMSGELDGNTSKRALQIKKWASEQPNTDYFLVGEKVEKTPAV